MAVYDVAVMLAGQFAKVLLHDPTVERGTIVLKDDGIYINGDDVPRDACQEA